VQARCRSGDGGDGAESYSQRGRCQELQPEGMAPRAAVRDAEVGAAVRDAEIRFFGCKGIT
jgi:hypothetical protein